MATHTHNEVHGNLTRSNNNSTIPQKDNANWNSKDMLEKVKYLGYFH